MVGKRDLEDTATALWFIYNLFCIVTWPLTLWATVSVVQAIMEYLT